MRTRGEVRHRLFLSSQTANAEPRVMRALATLVGTVALVVLSIGLSSCAGVVTGGAKGTGSSGTGSSGGSGSGGGDGTGTLSANPTTITFGSITDGTKTSQSVTLTNTGTEAANISAATISGAGLSIVGTAPTKIAAGASATIQIQFAPETPGAVTGALSIASDSSNPQMSVGLTGTGSGPLFSISPASLTFTNVIAGQTTSKPVTISNSGNAPLTLSAAKVSGTGFSTNGLSATASITAGQSMTFNVVFTPPAAATDSGTISFTDNVPGPPQALALSGTAIASTATLTTNPAVITFANTAVGATSKQAVTLKNSGNESLTVNSLTHTGSEFTVTGLTTPMTLAAGQSTSFTVEFTPTKPGSASGDVNVSGEVGGEDPSATVAMSGMATDGQLGASPATVSFGDITVGSSGTSTITLKNSGTASTIISGASVTGTGFTYSGLTTPLTLAAGQSTSFTVKYAPTSPASSSGSITVKSDASNPTVAVTLTGTGAEGTLSATPASVPFGTVATGKTSSQTITLKNGGTASVTVTAVSASGSGFSASALSPSPTIAAGGSATFTATFKPTVVATFKGSISVTSNVSSSPITIPLTGSSTTSTVTLGASATSLNFGSVDLNTETSLNVVFTNTGNSDLTVSGVTTTGTGFSASGVNSSTTLTPNQTGTLKVSFEPSTASSFTGKVTVASNATDSPATITLSGTGVSAPSSGGGGSGSGSGSGATAPPICGLTNDTTNHVPNATSWNNFVPPGVGGTYTDSGYCTVTRVTNFKGSSGAGCHYYATESPLDISDEYLMLYDCTTGGWFVDAGPKNSAYSIGTTVLSESSLKGLWSNDSEPTWDRTTPGKFWVTVNNSIESCTVNNSAKSLACSINHTFSEYSGYRISFMDETDMTPEGWLVTVGQNTQGGHIDVFLFNPATQTKSPVYTTKCTADVNSSNNGCIHKLIATPNNGVVIQFESSTDPENGNELWESPWAALSPVELNSGGTGPGGTGGTDHLDTGKDENGVENAVYEDYQNNPGPWGACPDGWRPTSTVLPLSLDPACLFDNRPNNPGWHVSWRGYPNTQFITYSAQANESTAEEFNNASGYAAPSSSNWKVYTNEIVMILFGANNDAAHIYRLALSHTRSNPGYFWSDARAAEGYSGNYVVFDSNSAWGSSGCGSDGGGECSDVYIIRVH
ncbi:MAG: choice-of-anchor D domain-containing protein [Candidatus Acidiferrales bacterium]